MYLVPCLNLVLWAIKTHLFCLIVLPTNLVKVKLYHFLIMHLGQIIVLTLFIVMFGEFPLLYLMQVIIYHVHR